MGITSSQPPKFQRSLSLRCSQRSSFLEYHMRLFKIDREIFATRILADDQIADLKSRLYSLRREFDARNYKEKYRSEFRDYHVFVVGNLEERMRRQVEEISKDRMEKKSRRMKRRKSKAPDPPYIISVNEKGGSESKYKSFWDEMSKFEDEVANFNEGRQSLKYKYLYHSLVVLLIRLDKIQSEAEGEEEREKKKCGDCILKVMRILGEKVAAKEKLETLLED